MMARKFTTRMEPSSTTMAADVLAPHRFDGSLDHA
jgi:hypothetical protein